MGGLTKALKALGRQPLVEDDGRAEVRVAFEDAETSSATGISCPGARGDCRRGAL